MSAISVYTPLMGCTCTDNEKNAFWRDIDEKRKRYQKMRKSLWGKTLTNIRKEDEGVKG